MNGLKCHLVALRDLHLVHYYGTCSRMTWPCWWKYKPFHVCWRPSAICNRVGLQHRIFQATISGHDASVTRNSLSGIRVLALQVFEACFQKLATQKLSRKTSAHPCHPTSTFNAKSFCEKLSILSINKGRYIRDLTIRQRRRPWKRRWKVDFASFHFFSRLFQGTQLLKRRELSFELKGRDRARDDRDDRIYRFAAPVLK